MVVTTEGEVTPLEDFLNNASREFDQTQLELKEVDMLIQQTTAEVERLAQRNTQITNRLRQVESALDTVPREDIREVYSVGLDTQQRLFTMRGQLEKLQSDRRHLTRYATMLRNLLDLVDYGDYEPGPQVEEADVSGQSLAIRIIEAQERERQRLSRQMHDGPAQSLTNLILQAEICERLFDVDPDRARSELATLKDAVAGTFQKVRGFILNLRPMMLDDLGLVPTLRRYVDSFTENSGVLTSLTVTGKERRLEPHREVIAFRLVQELLNNAYEYGHATNVQINLDMGDDNVRGAVEDNGSGFDLDERIASSDGDRFGLAMMRERMEMLGGRLHVESEPGRGARIAFELPVTYGLVSHDAE
ncbi:MAG: sensor histidine kinase [Chloroflexi bacterium]|nr:sensor histidine kinase [Chloroflexota bacterium]